MWCVPGSAVGVSTSSWRLEETYVAKGEEANCYNINELINIIIR